VAQDGAKPLRLLEPREGPQSAIATRRTSGNAEASESHTRVVEAIDHRHRGVDCSARCDLLLERDALRLGVEGPCIEPFPLPGIRVERG
jgi:hypothetical protein